MCPNPKREKKSKQNHAPNRKSKRNLAQIHKSKTHPSKWNPSHHPEWTIVNLVHILSRMMICSHDKLTFLRFVEYFYCFLIGR